jgi:hypothetical protein
VPASVVVPPLASVVLDANVDAIGSPTDPVRVVGVAYA